MNTIELIAKLAAMVRPLMTAYDSDLDYDLQLIANNSDIPFLHWTRKTGTDIALLWPSDHAKFPSNGETVEYLFGRCNRRELAHHPIEQAQYWQGKGLGLELVLYFDGKTLHRISPDQALDIAQCYYRQIIRAWSPRINNREVCVYCD